MKTKFHHLKIFIFLLLNGFIVHNVSAQQTYYWNTNGATGNSITSANWGTSPSGPFNVNYVAASNMVFTAPSTIQNQPNQILRNLTVTNGSTVIWGNTTSIAISDSPSFSSSLGTIATFDIGTGSLLVWYGQPITPREGTGFIKNGNGTWVIGEQANLFPAGFTLNAGSIILGLGTNVLGSGALTINGGALSANGYVLKNPSAISNIVVGGDFLLGGSHTVSTPSDGSITLSKNVSLGSNVSRRITVGGNITTGQTGVYTFNGILSGSNSNIIFDRLTDKTGVIVLGGANTYNGGTNIQAGIVHIGASGVLPDRSYNA